MKYCNDCGAFIADENQQVCEKCGAQLAVKKKTAEDFPMKWYKFLIYFELFGGAVINFVDGVNYCTGNIYTRRGLTAAQVYGLFGSALKVADIGFGIAMIALAAFGIYTRFRLAKFKKNGPVCLYLAYVFSLVFGLVYGIVVSGIIGTNSLNIVSMIPTIVLLICNYIYFNKRKELFVE